MKNKILSLAILLAGIAQLSHAQAPSVALVPYASGLASPVDITHCGDSRLFVVEQSGIIRIVNNGVVSATPFLNIDPLVSCCGEQGLLGLAFHPNYKQNGYFFVNYTNNSGHTTISRYTVNAADSNLANPASALIIKVINQPFANHNGGCIRFGKDGYLYIGMGDGGSGGDPGDRAQDMAEHLGKMLRIDIDNGIPYSSPASNPFINTPGAQPEIWASGLRNPWRFSFDRLTGDMWIGDVGQGSWEEIDFQPASSPGGENYGWRCYEGNHAYNTTGCQGQANYDSAFYEYSHAGGNCSVSGGFIYKGGKYADLFNFYFFADYCNNMVRVLKRLPNGSYQHYTTVNFTGASISCFGEDHLGELYVGNIGGGTIRRITSTVCKPTAYISAQDTVNVCADSTLLSTPWSDSLIFSWQAPSGGSTTNQIWANTTGWYKVTVVNFAACINTDSVYVKISGFPSTPSFTGLDSAYCSNSTQADTLIGNPLGGTFSGAGITADYFTPLLAGSGTHSITYMYTDSDGCAASTNQSVLLHPVPVPVITGLGTFYCSNFSSPVTLVGNPSGGIFSGAGISGNIFDPTTLPDSVYTISYSYTDSNGCSNSILQNVTVMICGLVGTNSGGDIAISGANPVNSTVRFKLASNRNLQINYTVADITGRVIYKNQQLITEGEQWIELPMQDAESGLYLWNINTGTQIITYRFAKAN